MTFQAKSSHREARDMTGARRWFRAGVPYVQEAERSGKVHYDDANLPVGFCALAIVAGSTVRSAILPFTRWLYPGHRHFLSSLAAPLAADENDPRNSLGLVLSYRSSKHFPKPSTLCSACDSQEVSLLLFPRCTFDVASTNAGG